MKLLKKILGAPNALLRKLAEVAVVKWLRQAGDGTHGETAQAIYNALAWKKTLTGVLIGGLGFIAESQGFTDGATWLQLIGTVFVAAGLADKAVRTPGRPDWAANSAWYRFLADNSGMLSTLLGSAFAYTATTTCAPLDLHWLVLSCAAQTKALGCVTLALVYLGILDTAFLSRTPLQAQQARLFR